MILTIRGSSANRGRPLSLFTICIACLIILLTPLGCSHRPILPIPSRHVPSFADDLQYKDLRQAIQRSLTYVQKKPKQATFTFAGRQFTYQHLADSLVFFNQLLEMQLGQEDLLKRIKQHFNFYQAGGVSGFNPSHQMLVTGYYQPLFEGRLKKKTPFLYPLYEIPTSMVLRHNGNGKKTMGRLDKGVFKPYWTRREIESGQLARGHEIVWLKHPMDAYSLHIQGSGLIRLKDGTIRGVHYATKNGRQYRSIGKFMVDTGRMKLEQASMDSIRRYIDNHPEEQEEILFHNDSYIFFHWTQTHGAIGNIGQELTPGRSIAADKSIFPPGMLAYLQTRGPVVHDHHVVDWQEINRFVTIQDTGSAIRGPGRVDLFWGAGSDAGLAAGRMKEDGKLILLLLKEKE